jgi:hypothetical protein
MANVDRRDVTLDMHAPVVITDGFRWVEHDAACPVCRCRKATFLLEPGVFLPCGPCRDAGWILRRRQSAVAAFFRWFRPE